MNIEAPNSNYNDEIDLREWLDVLWRKKKFIILVTTFFALGSVVYALSLTNYYRSEAVLIITDESSKASPLQGLGGIASMAGLNLQNSGQDKSMLVLETLKSRVFLSHLLDFDDVLPSLMAPKIYEINTKKLIYDEEIYDSENKTWVREIKDGGNSKPSYLEAYDTYKQQVIITRDANPNLITISVEHISPIFAKDFLQLIIDETDELMRQKDLKESSDAIRFLSAEMSKSSLVSMKDAINQLVQSRLEMQMMARISADYILQVVEPPFIPEKKFKPQRSLICIIGTLIGAALAIFWILIQHYTHGAKKSIQN